jgi:predicted GIY-YIG superfamily endonuclease
MPPSESRSWWVYILRCGDGTLYTGIALDVPARLAQHRAGTGARYTRGREPLELVYQEASPSRSAATRREAAIKRCSRRQKLQLIGMSDMNEGDCPVASLPLMPRMRGIPRAPHVVTRRSPVTPAG